MLFKRIRPASLAARWGVGLVIIKPSCIYTGGYAGCIKPVFLWATQLLNLGQVDSAIKP